MRSVGSPCVGAGIPPASFYRCLLEADRNAILRRRHDVTIQRSPEQMEQIQIDRERNLAVVQADMDTKRLADIELALKKLNDGSGFGECEECGDPIEVKRLKAAPEVRFCIGCKKKAEGGGYGSAQ